MCWKEEQGGVFEPRHEERLSRDRHRAASRPLVPRVRERIVEERGVVRVGLHELLILACAAEGQREDDVHRVKKIARDVRHVK